MGYLSPDFLLDVRVFTFLEGGYRIGTDSINVSEEDIIFGDGLSAGGPVVAVLVSAATLEGYAEFVKFLLRLLSLGRFESQEAPSLERELEINPIILNFARESEKFHDGIITGRNICVADNPVELVYLIDEGELSLRFFTCFHIFWFCIFVVIISVFIFHKMSSVCCLKLSEKMLHCYRERIIRFLNFWWI